MDLKTLSADNIEELLVKIIEFTRKRHRIIKSNLKNSKNPEYQPLDLEVEDFSEKLKFALSQHLQNHRLVWSDSENIKFGPKGELKLKPIKDLYAKELMFSDHDEYVEYQVEKLTENTINQKVASQLIKMKKETV